MVPGIFRMALPSRRNDAICLLGLRHRHIFMWQSLQILNIFKALTLKQVFVKPFFEKLEYHCLVESTTIESALLLCKTSFSKASVNPLSEKLTKWPNTLKQFVGNLPTNCLSVFGHFLGLAPKGVRQIALEVRNCFITKYAVLPLTTLLFQKLNFSIRTSYK